MISLGSSLEWMKTDEDIFMSGRLSPSIAFKMQICEMKRLQRSKKLRIDVQEAQDLVSFRRVDFCLHWLLERIVNLTTGP